VVTLKDKLIANTEAIEIVLKNNTLPPTQAERDKLLLYSGFGDLTCILLDPAKPDEFPQSEKKLIPLVEQLHATIRAFAPRKYDTYIESLKESVLTSFYTPPELVNSMDVAFQSNRFSFGNVLEPSAGLGVFTSMKGEHYTLIEQDELTGKILQALHPDKKVMIQGFEEIPARFNNSFNLVSSNIPFGNYTVFDPVYLNSKDKIKQRSTYAIHTYFFEKGLDVLKDGGMLAFITSTGVMDARRHQPIREHLLSRSHLISAVRLPENTFDGTLAQSDLIILQKDSNRFANLTPDEQRFIRTVKMDEDMDVYMNQLYADNQNRCIHTKATLSTNMYGNPDMRFFFEGSKQEIADAVLRIISHDVQQNTNRKLFLRFNKTEQAATNRPIQLLLFDDVIIPAKPKQTFLFNNPACNAIGSYQVNGSLIGIAIENNIAEAIEEKDGNVRQAISDYCRLRDAYFELKNYEIQHLTESSQLRDELNRAYNTFVNTPLSQHVFQRQMTLADFSNYIVNEPSKNEIQSLEYKLNGQTQKSDIFFEPVAFAKGKTEYTPSEALAFCRNKLNKVDLHYINRLTGMNTDTILQELQGQVFLNPVTGEYDTADVFLSGNVVEKLEQTYSTLKNDKDNYQLRLSYDALKSVLPERIPFHEIGINLGERWIPHKFYNDFATELFNASATVTYNPLIDNFSVTSVWNYYANQKLSVQTANRHYTNDQVLEFALHDRIPDCTKTIIKDNEEIRVPDMEGIQKINAAISEIQAAWYVFINRLKESEKYELESIYNTKFNCFVLPKFDGSFQTLPGLDLPALGYEDLYDSQKDAILRIKQQGGGIIDHEVGGGKTAVMCCAAYELKRLGICNKPLIIGVKANTVEIAKTFEKAYPDAKLLYASAKEFSVKEREDFFNRIQNNNWDCIIMTHEQFNQIPMSKEVQYQILNEERLKLMNALDTIDSDDRNMKRQKKLLEARLKNLVVKIKTLNFKIDGKKDTNVVDFATMGIDHIFCDESHKFKNLMFQTKHQRVAGIGNSKGSERAMNMKYAIRTIQRRTGRDMGATFLSGTTIVNSLTELYCLFDYLRPQTLERQGVFCFDAWAATFTRKTKELEFGVTGNLQFKERFREFVKVPELAKMYAEITDYKTAQDIGIERPEKNEILVQLEKTEAQRDMFERLKEFAKSGDGKLIFRDELSSSEHTAKMLIATSTSKKASIDMRLIDNEKYDDTSANRTQAIADNAFSYYRRFNDQKGTQFIFSDLGVCQKIEEKFDVYTDIKNKLVEKGVPEQDIAFVQDYKTDKQRERLQQDMNSGVIRILIGSTEKAGTGINAQERCVAIHHVDIPWTPKDFEQRNGRGVRKHNRVAKVFNDNKVDVFVYATKETLDVYKFNLVGNKDHFIKQIKNSSINVRTLDEGALDKESGMSYREYIAVLSGNQDLLEKARLERQISQFKMEEKIFNERKFVRENKIQQLQIDRQKNGNFLAMFRSDNEKFMRFPRDNKGNVIAEMVVGKQTYTSIKAFGEALNRELDKPVKAAEVYSQIGSYGGFGILLYSEKLTTQGSLEIAYQNKLFIQGELKYSYQKGNVARTPQLAGEYPQNALKRIGDKEKGLITQFETKNQESDSQIQVLRDMSFSFPNRDKLIEAEGRLRAINNKLERTFGGSDYTIEQDFNQKEMKGYRI
jgi:N12 class adenine-specific DNA methylase